MHFNRLMLSNEIHRKKPTLDVATIDEVLFQMHLVLLQFGNSGYEWVVRPAYYEIEEQERKPMKVVSSPGTATCGWCHQQHSIEQIKHCRWMANRIDPAVYEATKMAALNTASKLKKEKNG